VEQHGGKPIPPSKRKITVFDSLLVFSVCLLPFVSVDESLRRELVWTHAAAGTGKQQHNNNNSSHNAAKAVQQQASSRRALGDIGNLVGAMPVRSNVSKESIQE
jgi:hypothetical protein